MNKTITSSILSLICMMGFAGTEPANHTIPINHQSIQSSENKPFADQAILSQLKIIFPQLVIYSLDKSGIGNYWQAKGNMGTMYFNADGNVLMSAEKVLLFNYSDLNLNENTNVIKMVSECIGYPISEDNIDHGLHYFKANGGITVVTNENVMGNPVAILGAFSTIDQLKTVKAKLEAAQNQSKEMKLSGAITDNIQTDIANKKDQAQIFSNQQDDVPSSSPENGVQKALTFINEKYPENMVHFKSMNGDKGTITVFTDYTCPHCQALHKHLKEFLEKGYNVNYILLPRAGINSPVASDMSQVLCSVDPVETTEYLYTHHSLPMDIKEKQNCQANIATNLSFAKGFKVQGTPTLIGSNGKMTSGFSNVSTTLYKLGLEG